MPLLLAQQDALLKDAYEGSVREQLNNEVPLLKILEGSDRSWSGRRVVYPIHTTRNSGVGSRNENGTLPTGGNQGHELAVVTATYFYARGRLSGQTMAAGKHAFAEALATEMDGLVNDAKVDLGRQTWGTGDGRLAQVGVSATVDASQILLFNRFAEPQQPGARYINQNGLYDFGIVSNPDQNGINVQVTAIQRSSNPATTSDTILVTTTFSILSSSEFVFVASAGGCGIEAMGLQGIVDEFSTTNMWGANAFFGSALNGLNRATIGAWNAQIMGNSGVTRIIDSNLMQTAFDNIHVETGLEPDLIMGEHGVVRALLDSVASDRRYVSQGAPKYDAGFSSLSYNGVTIERDRQAPYNSLLVCKKAALKVFKLKEMGFADDDGSILDRVAGSDLWDFWLRMYWNIACDGNMKSLLFIRDIRTDL